MIVLCWLKEVRVPHRASLFRVDRLDTQDLERLGIGSKALSLLTAGTQLPCLRAHCRGGRGVARPSMYFDLLGQLTLQLAAAFRSSLPCQ